MNANEAMRNPNQVAHDRLIELAKTDSQVRELIPSEDIAKAIIRSGLTTFDIIESVVNGYADRPALGMRGYEIRRDAVTGSKYRHYLPQFSTITYGELKQRVEALANAWRHHNRHKLVSGEFVCMFGYTSTDFTIADLACHYAQMVAVPLQPNLPAVDLDRIFKDTQPAAVVASIANLELAVALAIAHESVRSIIVIDVEMLDESERAAVEAAQAELAGHGMRVALATLDELIDYGKGFVWTPLPRSEQGLDRTALLIYTSGSTGSPKGAILTDRIASSHWVGAINIAALSPTIAVCYAPMNHIAGRVSVFSSLAVGGTVYFSLKSDMTSLLEDMRLARPTEISFIPRVTELVYQHYQTEVQHRLAAKQGDIEAIRAQVRQEMKSSFLGDRLRRARAGSAPISPQVQEFLQECFDIALREVYGTTESGGSITYGNRINQRYVTAYKLRDVPELGYYTTDKPFPRGELLFKSHTAIPGYFKNPEATAELFDEDGFQYTSDIVEERGPNHVVWLDRRNNVLKLSQGEFVAIGSLEVTFESGSPVIKQIYLYGNSSKSYILAVVVPDMGVVTRQLGRDPEEHELSNIIRAALQETARAAGLKSFEIPRDFIIEEVPFSFENGLLSSVRKPLRPKLKERYSKQLEALYAQIEDKQQSDLALLRNTDSGLTILERVVGAIQASLGIAGIDLSKAQSFADLGGDSLGSVSLALLLEDLFHVVVPVNVILNPAGSAQHLARYIENALRTSNGASAPTFAGVHGSGALTIRARDLKLAAFLGQSALDNAATIPPHSDTKTVLISGASGYLGRFLCLEWLERMALTGGKVICLIRAGDAAAARRRLDEAFGVHDPALTERFRSLAAEHLEVLAGDLTDDRLGLSEEDYARLAEQVDQIMHTAALVNHILSYQNLFEPNVIGTAALIGLALTRRKKRIDYVSSIAVAHMLGANARECDDVRIGLPSIDLSKGNASGYAASKWAGEVLLREAHEQFGLPVNVFRSDMILGHSQYRGQINVPDVFTRLLYSVVVTGLAPGSFYEYAPDGQRADAHYDGLPVDFVAGAIVGIGAKPRPGFTTRNILNMHETDGISLDRIVDWIESAGFPVERVREHKLWLERFEMKLRALPEDMRNHSSLAILRSFARPHQPGGNVVPCQDFEAEISDLPIGPLVPHLSEGFIHKCLEDMVKLGLLTTGRANA